MFKFSSLCILLLISVKAGTFIRFLATMTDAVATRNSGRTIHNGNSGNTWYWFGWPYNSSVVTVFPALSSVLIVYVTFVPCGNAGIVPFQTFSSIFVISVSVHVPLPTV